MSHIFYTHLHSQDVLIFFQANILILKVTNEESLDKCHEIKGTISSDMLYSRRKGGFSKSNELPHACEL